MKKADNPEDYFYVLDGRKIIAGCDTCIFADEKNLFLEGHVIGAYLGTTRHRAKSTKVTSGDIVFGCCDDVVIRGDKILYPEEPWFSGSESGTKFKYKMESSVVLHDDPFRSLPEHCKRELEIIK